MWFPASYCNILHSLIARRQFSSQAFIDLELGAREVEGTNYAKLKIIFWKWMKLMSWLLLVFPFGTASIQAVKLRQAPDFHIHCETLLSILTRSNQSVHSTASQSPIMGHCFVGILWHFSEEPTQKVLGQILQNQNTKPHWFQYSFRMRIKKKPKGN